MDNIGILLWGNEEHDKYFMLKPIPILKAYSNAHILAVVMLNELNPQPMEGGYYCAQHWKMENIHRFDTKNIIPVSMLSSYKSTSYIICSWQNQFKSIC